LHDALLAPIVDLLESAEAQAGEALRELRQYASRVELDPQALRESEARIEALHAAGRRFRVRPEELQTYAEEQRARLKDLQLAVDPEALQREVEAAAARYAAAARKLSAKRKSAAQAFSKAVTEGMQRLAMFTNLPTKSLFTRERKSSWLKSRSSTLAFSLAAI